MEHVCEASDSYTEPVSLKVTVWLDTELPRKDLYPDFFYHHIASICAEMQYLIRTHSRAHPTVRSVGCEEAITYDDAGDVRVVWRYPTHQTG